MMKTEFNISADLPDYGGMRNLLIVPLKRSYIVILDGKELCIVWKGLDESWKELNEKLKRMKLIALETGLIVIL